MAGENPGGITEIMVSAVDSSRTKAANNMKNSNALFFMLSEKKRVDPYPGGAPVGEPIMYGAELRAQAYAGAQTLRTQQPRVLTQANYYKTNYVVPIVITGDEMADVSGQKGRVKLLAARTDAAYEIMKNTLGEDCYSALPTNGGLNIQGLQAMFPLDNAVGSFGGISRAENPWWRHYNLAEDFGGENPFLVGIEKCILAVSPGGGMGPDLGVADNPMYSLISAEIRANVRYNTYMRNEKFAEVNLQHIQFDGMTITPDGGLGGSLKPVRTLYGLNTKFIKYRPHKKWNLRAMKQNRPFNQDIEGTMLFHRALLTLSAMRYHFRMSDTAE